MLEQDAATVFGDHRREEQQKDVNRHQSDQHPQPVATGIGTRRGFTRGHDGNCEARIGNVRAGNRRLTGRLDPTAGETGAGALADFDLGLGGRHLRQGLAHDIELDREQ